MLVSAPKEPILKAIIKICIKINKNIFFLTIPGQSWSDGRDEKCKCWGHKLGPSSLPANFMDLMNKLLTCKKNMSYL